MDYTLLKEMPQNIEPLDWHSINDPEENRLLYQKLSTNKYKKHIMQIFSNADLHQLGSQFFCLDSKMKRVTYYMKYEVGNNGKLGSFVWQSLVWSLPSAAYVAGLPQLIFFEKLLPKFGTIATDSQQTWDGRRFWKLRIADAFNKQLNVFFYNFANHEIIKIDSYDDFESLSARKDVWGETDKHKMKRMVISNKDLPLNT